MGSRCVAEPGHPDARLYGTYIDERLPCLAYGRDPAFPSEPRLLRHGTLESSWTGR